MKDLHSVALQALIHVIVGVSAMAMSVVQIVKLYPEPFTAVFMLTLILGAFVTFVWITYFRAEKGRAYQ